MSQTAKILEMKILGFSQEHIAKHLGLSNELVGEVIHQNTRPSKSKKDRTTKRTRIHVKTKDRPAVKKNMTSSPSLLPEKVSPLRILEVKPGVYLLTAEDLIAFASHFQEPQAIKPDPYQDYVQKESFQEQYGISDTTLLRHQKEGLLKVYRLGNKLYLKKSQIVEALERGKL